MSDQTLDDSRGAVEPIYTRRGDQGETPLPGGHRVAKDGAVSKPLALWTN
jgi:cob(I)alamin adenosyltransferase